MQRIGEAIRWFQQELSLVLSTFKDKGGQRFSRPLILAAVAVYASYAALYAPPVKKAATLQRRIKAAQSTAQFAEQYKNLRDRLYQIQSQLPKQKDRGSWLTDTVVDSMKAETVIADSIMPPEESELSEFYYQKLSVTVQIKFPQLVLLIKRLEGTRPLIHLHQLDVAKRDEMPGSNTVNFGVSTLIPQK